MTFLAIVEAVAAALNENNVNEVIQVIEKLIALEQSISKHSDSNSSQNSSAK
jgi:hypothetical protein